MQPTTRSTDDDAARPAWLAQIAETGTATDDLDDLLETAAERDPRGPLETIEGLLDALRVRHAGDDVTLAMLAALQHFHLPDLLDVVREERDA